MNEEKEKQTPEWAINGRINERLYCRDYLKRHHMVCVEGCFYTVEGRIADEGALSKSIYDEIGPWVHCGVARKVDAVVRTMRMEARTAQLPMDEEAIHVANGTYSLTEGFTREKQICRCRLPVDMVLNAPNPKLWLQFLGDLLEPLDILTLQEFMGYCLLPTTRAQKMLTIVGKGGEGKSRIGVVMKALLGDNMKVGSIAKLEASPFARADLQGILVLVDDDLSMEGLTSTNHLKAIVTAEIPMDLERKGIQSYQGQIFSRLMAFGNGTLKSLYDRSHGFFRRQIILTAKPKPDDREDDPYLSDKLLKEKEGIFLWCLLGLHRLIEQDYHFTLSVKTRQNIEDAIADGSNVVEFMKSTGYIAYAPVCSTPTRVLYDTYLEWCTDNGLQPMSMRSFSGHLQADAKRYGIVYNPGIPIAHDRKARGFQGIGVLR